MVPWVYFLYLFKIKRIKFELKILFLGEPLLYLLEMPETNGQVKCEAIEEINPLKLNVSYFDF